EAGNHRPGRCVPQGYAPLIDSRAKRRAGLDGVPDAGRLFTVAGMNGQTVAVVSVPHAYGLVAGLRDETVAAREGEPVDRPIMPFEHSGAAALPQVPYAHGIVV